MKPVCEKYTMLSSAQIRACKSGSADVLDAGSLNILLNRPEHRMTWSFIPRQDVVTPHTGPCRPAAFWSQHMRSGITAMPASQRFGSAVSYRWPPVPPSTHTMCPPCEHPGGHQSAPVRR